MKWFAVIAVGSICMTGCLGGADVVKAEQDTRDAFSKIGKEKSPQDIAALWQSGQEAHAWISDEKHLLLVKKMGGFENIVDMLYTNGCPMVKVVDVTEIGDGNAMASAVVAQLPPAGDRRTYVWQQYQSLMDVQTQDDGRQLVLIGF